MRHCLAGCDFMSARWHLNPSGWLHSRDSSHGGPDKRRLRFMKTPTNPSAISLDPPPMCLPAFGGRNLVAPSVCPAASLPWGMFFLRGHTGRNARSSCPIRCSAWSGMLSWIAGNSGEALPLFQGVVCSRAVCTCPSVSHASGPSLCRSPHGARTQAAAGLPVLNALPHALSSSRPSSIRSQSAV